MSRRSALAVLTVSITLAAGVPRAGAVPDHPSGGREHAAVAPAARTDADHDRVDDALQARLAAASGGTRVGVIATGLGPAAARRSVGTFALRHRLPLIGGFSATMTAGQARALARHPRLRLLAPITRVRALDDGTDRDFGAAAARADRPGLDGSGLDSSGLDGPGVGICVVDTGIDSGHEQIAPRTVTFRDFIGTGTTSYDDHGHGTHVAAIAAGDGVGGATAATFRGVAPAASLYAAKVLDSSGSGPNDGVIAGINWCTTNAGVDIISLSLGDPEVPQDGLDPVSQAVNAAVALGVVAVVAAGNSGDAPGTVTSPGTAAGALTVGAVAEHSNPAGTPRHDDGIWLAAFSSRGPTADGRMKPDVTAPGVTVTSADAGTGAGYVTMSGTSMATPYVAGAVALGLEAHPSATPAQVRAALTGTARDVGAAGADNEYGAGLIDVRAFVDSLVGAAEPRRTPMQVFSHVSGSVPDHGSTTVPIDVAADGVGLPLAVTVTLDGTGGCVMILGVCWPLEWSPDLDAELVAPNGSVVAHSECALSGVSCASGRQETLAVVAGVAGRYLLRVFTFEGGPDDGAGGAFVADVAQGPLAGAGQPPPPPANLVPVANAGTDQRVVANKKTKLGTFTLSGAGSSDPDGTIVGRTWRLGTQVVGTSSSVTLSRKVGTYTFTLTVTDDDGATDTDDVVVRVTQR
jgi:serine protease AprX